MIINFACRETKKIWNGEKSRRLPPDIQQQARLKLRMLNNSFSINDLRIPPNNRLEKLKGERANQHSIRINAQWRICFVWDDANNNASNVEIVDYH